MTSTTYAAFVAAAIAEVARNDRDRRTAELSVAADFDRWADELFEPYLRASGVSGRVVA